METDNQVKSIVYLTVNTVNNKIYVGIHITNKPFDFDGYYGNGITGTSCYHFKHPKTLFQKACKKYGLDAFRRYTLFVYDSYEEAQNMERQIVTEDFVKRSDTYNIALGGGAGLVPEAELPICQYNLDGTFVKKYRSKNEAARQIQCSIGTIINAELTRGTCKGFYWSQREVPILDTTTYKTPFKEVHVYNLLGEYEATFPTKMDCARKYDVNVSCITRAIERGYKSGKHYFSYEKVEKFVTHSKKRKRHSCYYQYSLTGEFLQEVSIQEAKDLLKTEYYKLHQAIQGKYSCGGYLWSINKTERVAPLQVDRRKKIAQYDLEGNLVKVWNSYSECVDEFHCLRKVLKGARNQTKGYYFKYIDDNLKDIV